MFAAKIKNDTQKANLYLETPLTGAALLNTPELNKGTAFTAEERRVFQLDGLLPARIENLEEQVARAYQQYQNQNSAFKKNLFLNALVTTNQVLFYRLVADHVEEILPVLYTPTVGEAVKTFSQEWLRAQGLYLSYLDLERLPELLHNRCHKEIDLIVVTDGERILGIGDQGVGGIYIPVAKLMLYSLFGGIHPWRTLPIVLDVGTNNQLLLNDPNYLGWRHTRVTGHDYDSFIAAFINAVKKEMPGVFLQWEDFGRDHALPNLNRFRDILCSFNDDIQGTAVVALATILSALTKIKQNLSEQKIVIVGAGSAGVGIANMLILALQRENIDIETARKKIWFVDQHGLLQENSLDMTTGNRPYVRSHEELNSWRVLNREAITLAEVVSNAQPTILIGCSGIGGLFTEEIIKTMARFVKRPIILPLSNPTEKSEAKPEDIGQWTEGRALMATGSPFAAVSQCNNALTFPGIGLGVIASKANKVSDGMLWAAAEALRKCALTMVPAEPLLLPPMARAAEVARQVALAVAQQAQAEQLSLLDRQVNLEKNIEEQIWQPYYLPYRKSI
jgi:malate dehydrogenase (oxaloacetate-decarboxylating)